MQVGKLQKLTFFQPKTLSLFSTLANIYAWLSLVLGIVYLPVMLLTLDGPIQLMSPITGHWWEGRNLISEPVLRAIFPVLLNAASIIGNFFLFKSVSIGLNILLELGFTMLPDEDEIENE